MTTVLVASLAFIAGVLVAGAAILAFAAWILFGEIDEYEHERKNREVQSGKQNNSGRELSARGSELGSIKNSSADVAGIQGFRAREGPDEVTALLVNRWRGGDALGRCRRAGGVAHTRSETGARGTAAHP